MYKRKSVRISGMNSLKEKLKEISESIDNAGISTYDIEKSLQDMQTSLTSLATSMDEIHLALYKILRELEQTRQQTEKWKKVKLISR